ncbi:MAG: hypothetical protein IJT74_01645 [Bacteroidales bacterium]|nr:hypothetical protein [Bacteroidales bacterium]
MINGLYEDLNTYNSNALFEWDERIPSLRNSNQWNSVIEAYKGVSEFGLPAENYANDGFITVSRYVDTIKKKDSIQRKKYDMQLAARYLDNKSIWRKKDLSEFVCTKGLWEPLASIELKNYQHYYSQSFDLKSVKSLATIDSLCTSILKNDRHDYYRLKDRIRSANIIYDDMLNIEQYIVALKDYNSYLLNPYTDERLKKNIHLMY